MHDTVVVTQHNPADDTGSIVQDSEQADHQAPNDALTSFTSSDESTLRAVCT